MCRQQFRGFRGGAPRRNGRTQRSAAVGEGFPLYKILYRGKLFLWEITLKKIRKELGLTQEELAGSFIFCCCKLTV